MTRNRIALLFIAAILAVPIYAAPAVTAIA